MNNFYTLLMDAPPAEFLPYLLWSIGLLVATVIAIAVRYEKLIKKNVEDLKKSYETQIEKLEAELKEERKKIEDLIKEKDQMFQVFKEESKLNLEYTRKLVENGNKINEYTVDIISKLPRDRND